MFKNHLKTALRNLAKNKLSGFINIFGLSVGMTAAVLILLWVKNETSYDRYHPQANQIYRITAHLTDANWTWATTPYTLGDAVQSRVPEVKKVTRIYRGWQLNLSINNVFFTEKKYAYIDSQWFNMFHYDFIEGNPASFYQQPFSILLTASAAKKYFGNQPAMGQLVRIDTVNYRVQAVVKDNPSNSSFQFDMLIPLAAWLSDPGQRKNELSGNNFNYLSFLQLNEHANPITVGKKITDVLKSVKKDNKVICSLIALKDMHFETGLTSTALPTGNRKSVYIFSILAGLLLLIACINYVNLTTARASLRSREVGVRKMVGAGRGQLFLQFLLESVLISLLALFFTVLLVEVCLPLFNSITEKQFSLPFNSPILWQVLGATLLAALLLNGIYPAIVLSSFKPLNVFRGMTLLKVKDASLRKGLVVLQFSISVMLIIGAIVIYRQLHYIQTSDPGYNKSQVFTFNVPWKAVRQHDAKEDGSFLNSVKEELKSNTNISGITLANQPIVNMTSSNSGSADWDGHDTTYIPTVSQLSADADFKDVFQVKMAEGRWFMPGSQGDEHNFILNETAVREFNIHKPVLGQRFTFQGDTGKIIGIVKDFHYKSMHEKIGPLAIFNKAGWRYSFFVKAKPGNVKQALQAAENSWKRILPNLPFDYTFLDETFDNLYKDDQRASTLIFSFSIIAIVICALGLLGLSTFTTEQRNKEIGIRKVLGASVQSILLLLSKEFVKLILISLVIAVPLGWYFMNQWLQDFAYRINLSWWIFIIAGIISLLIAIITIVLQAFKAVTANPVNSLRSE